MNETSVVDYMTTTFPEVETTMAYGYTFFFYRSDRLLPFATLISSNQEYDRISNLDRPGVFRLNIGVSRKTFQSLFSTEKSTEKSTGKVDVSNYDFTTLDVIMPHPEYAQQHFICVLSPSEATFERVGLLLAEAYDMAVRRSTSQSKNK